MSEEKIILDEATFRRTLARLAHEIIEIFPDPDKPLALVGIRRRGVPIAEMLKSNIERFSDLSPELGVLDITLYRDDLSERYADPQVNGTVIPFDVTGRSIILVDDVLFTGRTARAAMDALISLGLFSLCGRQVSLIVVTALLTIIGYSVNDTVVVFDRIREQLHRDQRTPFRQLCNEAINACLGRTVITSITTFFAVAALFAFGDGSIYDFALMMLLGVIAGTYSSIFIATPIMAWWYREKRPSFEEESEEQQSEQA